MKRRSNFLPAPTNGVRTGEHCPRTGWWAPAGGKASTTIAGEPRFIGEGSVMPSINGIPGTWLPRSVHTESALIRRIAL